MSAYPTDFECPICGAPPGIRCTNYNGQFCAPHYTRNRRAIRENQGLPPEKEPGTTQPNLWDCDEHKEDKEK